MVGIALSAVIFGAGHAYQGWRNATLIAVGGALAGALAYWRKSVRPGMEVRLEPSTVKREEFGTLVGTIMSISEFPITPQGMLAELRNDSLVTRFSRDGAPYAALVRLERDESTTTGYHWAVGRGPQMRLTSGTLARAEITTRHQRPLDLVVPLFKRLTGIAG